MCIRIQSGKQNHWEYYGIRDLFITEVSLYIILGEVEKIEPRGGIRRSEKGHEPRPETLGWVAQAACRGLGDFWEDRQSFHVFAAQPLVLGELKLVSKEETCG